MSIPKDLHYNWWLPPENVNQPPAPDRVQVGGAFRFSSRTKPESVPWVSPASWRKDAASQLGRRLPDRYLIIVNIGYPRSTSSDIGFGDLIMSVPRVSSELCQWEGAQPKLCILADRRSINQPCRWVLPSRFPFNKKHLLMLCLAFVDAENVRNASSDATFDNRVVLTDFDCFPLKNSLAPGQVDDSPSWAIHVHLRPERWSPLPTRNPEPRRKPRQDARDPEGPSGPRRDTSRMFGWGWCRGRFLT